METIPLKNINAGERIDMPQFIMDNDMKSRDKLEDIYKKYKQEMYYTAFKILNNIEDSHDVVQSSFLKLVNYLDKIEYVECKKTKGLITTIVKNGAIDLYRYKRRHTYIPLDQLSERVIDSGLPLDQLIMLTVEAKWIADKLTKLSEDYAKVIILKYYHDITDSEISKLLNISHENVRTRLHRAKKALRKLIEESNDK